MQSRLSAALAAATLALFAAPSLAQDGGDWSGFYIGGNLGASEPMDDDGSSIRFDTNLDGGSDDTVRTGAGADAFSPGFCDGAANDRTPAGGCRNDKGGADYGVRAGFDWQAGRLVYGLLAEYTQGDARDSVTAFSTTPALYTMTRDLDTTLALRARVGYVFGATSDYLAYGTVGAVRAEIDHSFRSSNTANAFTGRGDDQADGYQAGIGIERKVLDNLSLGLEYLYTSVKDDDYRVRTSQGTAPATNPFILTNPAGTDFKRSDEDFDVGSLRLTATFRF